MQIQIQHEIWDKMRGHMSIFEIKMKFSYFGVKNARFWAANRQNKKKIFFFVKFAFQKRVAS